MSTLNQKKFDLKGYLTLFLEVLKLMFHVSGGVSPVWKLARYVVRPVRATNVSTLQRGINPV
jgi:hypothetical protein